ncbi:MAG: hypothetical protein ACYTXC_03760 [Nostoc sp.]
MSSDTESYAKELMICSQYCDRILQASYICHPCCLCRVNIPESDA